ncbi:DMT family transporter [Coralloluteibacterium stylophorae]|uniref:DMT family transporter n=1 Tax=Coralloluteibacterium stylophorae TaxID=1776034 RepID=A0A8J7VV97_9GAMM|nr:DMT family transporter [Coralloluteibacterium stylophorae]MBS7455636.1 DMT family transporter [Coralloluteibacterium stylophorae]
MNAIDDDDGARRDILRAVGLMLCSAGAFACMAVTIRKASAELHPFEIAFFRNLFGMVFALPLLARHGWGLLRTTKLHLYFTRCLIGVVSMLCGFSAIVYLPLAQAVTLSYSTPLFVTIAAVLVLGEVVRARRWSAVAAGFVGVLLIVRPGTEGFSAMSLVALGAAVLSAGVAIGIKILSRTEKSDAIVLYTTLFWVPMSLVPALFVWTWPHGWTWLWIVGAGFLGTLGHMFWTRALKLGDASLLTPISFAQVPIVAVLGWALFGETVGPWTALGALVIFGSNAYIAHREATLARRAGPGTRTVAIAAADAPAADGPGRGTQAPPR